MDELKSACRGTMVLRDAVIQRDVGLNFVVTQGDAKQARHIKYY